MSSTDNGDVHAICVITVPSSYREAKTVGHVRRKLRYNEREILDLVAKAIFDAVSNPMAEAQQIVNQLQTMLGGEAGT